MSLEGQGATIEWSSWVDPPAFQFHFRNMYYAVESSRYNWPFNFFSRQWTGYLVNDLPLIGERDWFIRTEKIHSLWQPHQLYPIYELTDLYNIFSVEELRADPFNEVEGYPIHTFTARDAHDVGYTLAEVRSGGYTIADFQASSFTLQEMNDDAGFTGTEMKAPTVNNPSAGYTVADLYGSESNIIYTLPEIRDSGYTIPDFQAGNFTIQDMHDAGFTGTEMKAHTVNNPSAGYTVVDLYGSESNIIYPLPEIRDGGNGYTIPDFQAVNFTIQQMYQAEFTVAEFMAQGYTLQDMHDAGFTATEMRLQDPIIKNLQDGVVGLLDYGARAGGTSEYVQGDHNTLPTVNVGDYIYVHSLKNLNFPHRIFVGKIEVTEIDSVGRDGWQLSLGGGMAIERAASSSNFRWHGNNLYNAVLASGGNWPSGLTTSSSWQSYIQNYTTGGVELELFFRTERFWRRHPPHQLYPIYELTELYNVFSVEELRDDVDPNNGYGGSNEYPIHTFTAKDAHDVGYTLAQVRSGGYTIDDFQAVNFTIQDMHDAGFTVAEMKAAGYTVIELHGNTLYTLS